VQLLFNAMPTTMPHAKAGRLRALAVTGLRRAPEAPELPTVAETLPGYEIITWFGVLAPAGTPQPVLERLDREFRQALDKGDVRSKLGEMGVTIDAGGPAAFASLTKAEIAKWSRLIRVLGLKPEG
jgi:tripartite-type tricarboxylate transporter receptor subunit TctC